MTFMSVPETLPGWPLQPTTKPVSAHPAGPEVNRDKSGLTKISVPNQYFGQFMSASLSRYRSDRRVAFAGV
jgi:hypothetical protein